MVTVEEKWVVAAKKADFEAWATKFGIDKVLARILRNRDLVDEKQIQMFLYGSASDMYNPFLMTDMKEAAELLLCKSAEDKKIRVIGDYDVDGVCSTYILTRGLRLFSDSISYMVPHRVRDGYGLNERIIQEAIADGIDTIVTCDNGIAAEKEIALAKKHGLTVIVTDHHEVPYMDTPSGREEKLPTADCIVNPKRKGDSYPYKEICGAVIAYKLIEALLEIGSAKAKGGMTQQQSEDFLQAMLEMAALATICDVMPLLDENRIIVKNGLASMENTQNLGIRALLRQLNLEEAKLTSYHMGFMVGPCINAAGRLESATEALEFLLEEDEKKRTSMAIGLASLNEQRKDMTEQGISQASKLVDEMAEIPPVLILYLEECHESIAGIVAGRIREKYERPTIILTDSGDILKGSGRSIEAYHMYEHLHQVEDLLIKYGGHKLAAGLSIQKSDLEEFTKRMIDLAQLEEEDFVRKILIDVPMPIHYIKEELVESFAALEPFGTLNPKPLFAQKALGIERLRIVGKNRNVANFYLKDDYGTTLKGVYFGDAEQFVQETREGNGKIDIIYYPDINEYQGRSSIQIVVKHYKVCK